MSNKKISELTQASSVTANDLIQIVDIEDTGMAVSGTNKRATAQLMANELGKLTNITAAGSTTARTLANRFADVVNVKDFGAVGDGVTDDTSAIQAAFLAASSASREIYFPSGTYFLNTWSTYTFDGSTHRAAVFIATNNTVSVRCSKNAVIKAGAGLSGASPGAVFWFRSQSGALAADGQVSWSGGYFDLSSLPTNTTGVTGIRFEQKLKEVRVDGVTFDHGVQTAVGSNIGVGGGDESILIVEPEFASVTNCSFLGAPDIGIYLSGNSNVIGGIPSDSPRYGRRAIVSGCYFYRCSNGIASKRYFKKTIISNNHFFECAGGVLLGTTDSLVGNNGRQLIVSNNYFNKMQGGALRIDNTESAIITGNEIVDYRRWISDGTTETQVTSGNVGGSVDLAGSTQCTVTGNVIGFKEWIPVSTANKFSTGISFKELNGVGTTNSIVTGNVIAGCYMPVSFSNLSSGNIIGDNKLVTNTVASQFGTGNNRRKIDMGVDRGDGFEWIDSGTTTATGYSREIVRFEGVSDAENYIRMVNAALGSPVIIRASGVDTNIDLQLTGKGSGNVRFGTHLTTSDVPITGYIQIKDSEGTVRKLAVIA